MFNGYKNINLNSQVKSVKEQIASSHEHKVSKQNNGEYFEQCRSDKLPVRKHSHQRAQYIVALLAGKHIIRKY